MATVGFRPGTLRIQQTLGEPDSISFAVYDRGGLQTFPCGTPISVVETFPSGSVARFGGYIHASEFQPRAETARNVDGDDFIWSVDGIGYAAVAGRERSLQASFASTFTQPFTVLDVANYLVSRLTDYGVTGNIYSGAASLIINKFSTDNEYVRDSLNRLRDLAGFLSGQQWIWYIDENKVLTFCPISFLSTFITIGQPTYGYPARANKIRVRRTLEQYANLVILKVDHYLGDPITDVFVGNGDTTFTLSKPAVSQPIIKVNGLLQTVGIDGIDNYDSNGNPVSGAADWYWNVGSTHITQDTAGATLGGGDTLTVDYVPDDIRFIEVLDAAEVAARGRYSLLLDLEDSANSAQAQQLANAALQRHNRESFIVRCTVPATNVQMIPGQQYSVSVPETGFNAYMMLRSVTTFDEDATLLWRDLELMSGPIVYTSAEWFRRSGK